MKQKPTEVPFGRHWKFMVVAAGVGALTLVAGLWLGASSSTTPTMGDAEAILVSQPGADTAASGTGVEYSYVAP